MKNTRTRKMMNPQLRALLKIPLLRSQTQSFIRRSKLAWSYGAQVYDPFTEMN